jgi:hypothetical protein
MASTHKKQQKQTVGASRRTSAKRRATNEDDDDWTVSKHYITQKPGYDGDLNVKVRRPDSVSWNRVQAVLDRNHPLKASLDQVSRALAKLGASFVPWDGGEPGYSRAYK